MHFIFIKLLKKMYVQLKNLLDTISDEEHILFKDKDIAALKHKGRKANELNHIVSYFSAMHEFIKFYKEVFEHMIIKEEHLLKKKKK